MPFVISDNYPLTVVQPVNFVISVDGGAAVLSPPVSNPDQTKYLKFDISSLPVGTHKLDVRARNEWGDSVTVPFVFTSSVPGVPTGLRLLFP